ncbi:MULTISPECIES: hypothetical protein [Streptomycetaceae]|uniref:hypothetical protein n=1 Tax=Streptomycetaceae TaxID=2062 RepID=UPI001574FB1E|nr:hypothetical protein [Streptomyces sp. CB01881]
MALFLLIVIIAIVLGLVGVAVHGLLWLLAIGIVVLIADVVYLAARRRRTAR